MDLRVTLVLLVSVQWCVMDFGDDAEGWCERVCFGSRPATVPACPPTPPACPVPVCPPPVVNLTCPEPVCPPPVVNLTCPEPRCPTPSPPPPPTECPPSPTCPACTQPALSTTPTTLSAVSASPQATVPFKPFGYLRYPNVGVYKLYPEAMWLKANATCAADGTHLAVPNTVSEVDVLLYIMERRNTNKAFIGLHDYFIEGNYMTVLGHPMNRFQHSLWGSGEPDGGVKRNVVYLKSDGHIHDEYNTTPHPFICELQT